MEGTVINTKRVLGLTVAAIMTTQGSGVVFAQDCGLLSDSLAFVSRSLQSTENSDLASVRSQISALESKYGLRVNYIRKSQSDKSLFSSDCVEDCLSFDTVADFDRFVKELKSHDTVVERISVNDALSGTRGTKNVSIWAPFSGWGMAGVACWQNTNYEYEYEKIDGKWEFTTADITKSYISGLNMCSWIQDGKACNIKTNNTKNDCVEGTVTGHYLLGVKIGDFDIGASIPDEWNTCIWME